MTLTFLSVALSLQKVGHPCCRQSQCLPFSPYWLTEMKQTARNLNIWPYWYPSLMCSYFKVQHDLPWMNQKVPFSMKLSSSSKSRWYIALLLPGRRAYTSGSMAPLYIACREYMYICVRRCVTRTVIIQCRGVTCDKIWRFFPVPKARILFAADYLHAFWNNKYPLSIEEAWPEGFFFYYALWTERCQTLVLCQ